MAAVATRVEISIFVRPFFSFFCFVFIVVKGYYFCVLNAN